MERMVRLLVSALLLLVAGCASGQAATPHHSPRSTAATAPLVMAGGCGATRILKGAIPAWLDVAGGHNNPATVPYALATPDKAAAGFIFGYPLRSGHPANPDNKILWVVGSPRAGSPLAITARPLGSAAPVIGQSLPDSSGPGEIYPSVVDVPTPGCWHLDLSWAGHRAALDLEYG
jgi:hypothetical protein